MCGNTSFHRDGIVGAIYRCFSQKLPLAFATITEKICPNRARKNRSPICICCCNCCSNICRYTVIFFFYLIYLFFVLVNFCNVYPKSNEIFSNPQLYCFLSVFVIIFPWLFVFILNFVDPGTITPTNVKSYLKIYPYDNLIYKPTVCRTTNLPVVPRSRYDRYTNRRIAFVFILKWHFFFFN